MFQDLKEAGHKVRSWIQNFVQNQFLWRVGVLIWDLNQSDPDDPNGPDIDIKLEELKENIRRADTEKMKAESVISVFRDAGINVDEFMKDIDVLSASLEIQRSGSFGSLKTESLVNFVYVSTFFLL